MLYIIFFIAYFLLPIILKYIDIFLENNSSHLNDTIQFLRSFSLPLIYSRRVVVSYKRKYVHKLLVNRLLKPAQDKVWLSELTVPQ